MPRRIRTVDVFTSTPFKGNPVAVILDAEGLNSEQMQTIANWTNLSETTFVLPAADVSADYTLRIFTPCAELPFAGHPTIGSAHAVLEAGIATPTNGKLIQQCAKGLVEIAVPDDWRREGVSFRLPNPAFAMAPDPHLLAEALGADAIDPPMVVDVGPRWVIVHVEDASIVEHIRPNFAALANYDHRHATTGLTVFGHTRDAADTQIVRSFAPADGIDEDPVCGSGNGAVAAYRLHMGQVAIGDTYTAAQGMSVGRNGRVYLRYATDGIHVGGRAVTCVEGRILD